MRLLRCFLLLLACLSIKTAISQTNDFGGIAGVDFTKKIARSWEINLEEEVRIKSNFSQYDRFKSTIGIEYIFLRKHLKAGINGEFINKYTKDHYYQNRYVLNAQLTYQHRIKQFKLSYRAKWYNRFYNENRGDFDVNPEMYLRNRFEVEYSILNKPVKISFSSEFFWRLNDNKQKNIVDNFRTIIAADYRFNSLYAISVFLRADNEVQVKNPENIYYLGVYFKIKQQ